MFRGLNLIVKDVLPVKIVDYCLVSSTSSVLTIETILVSVIFYSLSSYVLGFCRLISQLLYTHCLKFPKVASYVVAKHQLLSGKMLVKLAFNAVLKLNFLFLPKSPTPSFTIFVSTFHSRKPLSPGILFA